MAHIILPRRFTQQPQGAVKLDPQWDNAIAFVSMAGAGPADIKTNTLPTVIGTVNRVATRNGMAYLPADTSSTHRFTLTPIANMSNGYAMLVFTNPSAAATNKRCLMLGNEAATAYNQSSLVFNMNKETGTSSGLFCLVEYNNAFGARSQSTSGAVNGDWHIFIANRVGGATQPKLYRDGIDVTGIGDALSGFTVNAGVHLGAPPTSSSQGSAHESVLHVVFNRALSTAEIAEVSRNPWQIFKRNPRVLYFDAGGGGVTGTIGITLESVVTALTGTTTVLGSITSALGDATTALTGTTTVTGSIANTLEDAATVLNGDVGQTGPVGDIASNLDDSTASLTGTTAVVGTIATTLEDSTTALTGTTTIVGTIANTLDDVVTFLYGFPGVQGLVARLRTMIGTGT